jgi:uncharacterized membrane protein
MVKDFLSEKEKEQIVAAIQEAEDCTSGEIKVHLENKCAGEVMDRAKIVFNKLKMYKTEARNGVLFYLAVQDRKFAILGDAGIDEKVPDNFWDEIKNHMGNCFSKGEHGSGLREGVLMAGEALKKHFPCKNDDTNELPDDLSFGHD